MPPNDADKAILAAARKINLTWIDSLCKEDEDEPDFAQLVALRDALLLARTEILEKEEPDWAEKYEASYRAKQKAIKDFSALGERLTFLVGSDRLREIREKVRDG